MDGIGDMDEFAPGLELEDDGLLRGRISFTDLLEEKDVKDEKEVKPPRKKKRVNSNVQNLLEAVIAKQQKFFSDLLESIERKEQIREQIRQEKEEKWRAEERAQLGLFNNAMLILTQELTGGDGSSNSAMPLALANSVVGSPEAASVGPKKRSKNWKSSEVLHLIKLRGEMESRFANCMKRAGLWDELSEGLAAVGVKRDGKQCREKWDKLTAEYKDVVDGKKDQNDSPYFAELTEILGRAGSGEVSVYNGPLMRVARNVLLDRKPQVYLMKSCGVILEINCDVGREADYIISKPLHLS
ncbi:hypothetical protein R1sor_012563 [Riccia sorocarpa]|uniref:Myb-like domain-containing protein n=1 Tax=Riccia sorocarpa TaxID=122646 RepID=A0ABD3I848_9MARC